jgi:hypothetical protein
VFSGIASFGFWGARNSVCVANASECANSLNLTQSSGPGPNVDQGTNAQSARAFCEELYGPATVPVTVAGNIIYVTAPIDACVICVQQLQGCVEPTLPILYAGIALLLLTVVPCMYFCCCSNKPDPAAKYL